MSEIINSIWFFFAFDDAQRAMGEGVFAITSAAGYSINKSLFFYAAFLLTAIVVSFILIKVFKEFFANYIPQNCSQERLVFPKLKIKEYIFLILIIVVVGAANVLLREKTFNTYTYYTEEFYNLAATNELEQETFSIIYPYSAGNLIIGSVLRGSGISLIYYKIFLNILAIIAIYFSLATVITKIRYRFLAFVWIVGLFFWVLIEPTLHANMLRLFMPVISVMLLFHCVNKYHEFWYKKLIALTLVFTAILFFGAADSIAVFLVLYVLFSLYQWINKNPIKEKIIFIIPPLLAVVTMFLIFGLNYAAIAVNQIRSISFYSGHPNAAPYYSLFTIFHSVGIGDVVKSGIYTSIFYLPFVIMASLILYLFILWQKKDERNNEPFVGAVLLLFTFILYYRQSFGNAGPGRVVGASTVLIFLLLVIKKYYQPNKIQKIIFAVSITFFIICTSVGFYFLRYSLIYLYNAHQNRLTANGLIDCSKTPFGSNLKFTDFTYCDKDLIEKLVEIKTVIADKNFYVYDDTFGLYYLLNTRPVVLMPSLYMAYTKEDLLVDKMKAEGIEFMVYPRQNHFFGVPDIYLKDQRFMKVINSYRDANFKRIFVSPMFEIFQLIK